VHAGAPLTGLLQVRDILSEEVLGKMYANKVRRT
jgi:hypothetical protein